MVVTSRIGTLGQSAETVQVQLALEGSEFGLTKVSAFQK